MKNIKKCISARFVNEFFVDEQRVFTHQPKAGDVAIFRVKELFKHTGIQDENGVNTYIFAGDYIMAVFGNRYASNQFEGYVPTGFQEMYHLIGKGGIVGTMVSSHAKLKKNGPTTLELIGFATGLNGQVINTKQLAVDQQVWDPNKERKSKVILALGSGMDSGKSTSAAYLCRGLKNSGKKVAYIKLTGTLFDKDRKLSENCGADVAIDFGAMGYPSTYLCGLQELLDLYESLLAKVEWLQPDYIVVEIADGLLQRETNMLLKYHPFMETIHSFFLACGDSLAVMGGLHYLNSLGYRPFAVTGLFTASPLMIREVKSFTPLPVLDLDGLLDQEELSMHLLRKFARAAKVA
ncbi:MAG: hypothetical protein AAF598_21590 [Bacteroidota bacterium]